MSWKLKCLLPLGDRAFNKVLYYTLHIKKGAAPSLLNLDQPKTFNEKTIWLKLHYRHPNAHQLADKILVKDFVKGKIGESHIIKTLAIYGSASEIQVDALPSAFVLKASHGSNWNIVCRRKEHFDIQSAKRKISAWLKLNYGKLGREYQYSEIKPRIICETFLEDGSGQVPLDFKIFCFSGRPALVQVDVDRETKHTRAFYSTRWQRLPFTTLYPASVREIPRPSTLSEMLSVASILSQGLPFARVDLYSIANKVYFGEITLHHGGGFEPFFPSHFDRDLGRYLHLPTTM